MNHPGAWRAYPSPWTLRPNPTWTSPAPLCYNLVRNEARRVMRLWVERVSYPATKYGVFSD
jgi:hypothetical protein